MHEFTSHFNITVINYLVSAIFSKVCFSHIRKKMSIGKSVITLKCNAICVLLFKTKMSEGNKYSSSNSIQFEAYFMNSD